MPAPLKMPPRRSCRRLVKKLALLGLIGLTVALAFLLHLSPDSIHLDALQRAYGDLALASSPRSPPDQRQQTESSEADDDEFQNDTAKARIDAILNRKWSFNKQASDDARREMKQYFNPFDVITMTSDDVATGRLRRFYLAKKLSVQQVPPGLQRLLPKHLLFRHRHFRTCSLVGNGGVLRNSTCGRQIDAADFVVRCNFAPLRGYQADVGSRTDVVTFNPSIIERYQRLGNREQAARFEADLRRYQGRYVLWVPVFSRHYVTAAIRTLLDFFERHLANLRNVQLAFPGNVLPDISEYWATKGIDEERISTGLLMYNMASALCDEIHMYGFYPFPEFDGKAIPYHYDHAPDRVGQKFDYGYRRFHELPDEFAYLKKLHKAGVVQLHVGRCPAGGA